MPLSSVRHTGHRFKELDATQTADIWLKQYDLILKQGVDGRFTSIGATASSVFGSIDMALSIVAKSWSILIKFELRHGY